MQSVLMFLNCQQMKNENTVDTQIRVMLPLFLSVLFHALSYQTTAYYLS